MEVARWLSDEVKAGVYGSDTWAGEVVPNPDPGCAFCVHEHMLTRHGIVHQENAVFDDLIADKAKMYYYNGVTEAEMIDETASRRTGPRSSTRSRPGAS